MLFLLLLFFALSFASSRVVALSPAINEIIYSLGEGESIVANTTYSNFPKEAKEKTKVGGYFTPSFEAILATKPTAVIMQNDNIKIKDSLKRVGIDVVGVDVRSLEDIKNAIEKIGSFFGKEKRAKELISKIEEATEGLRNIVEDRRILVVFGAQSDIKREIFISGKNLYFHDIIEESGNRNAYSSTLENQPILNMESIISLNPEIVIIITPPLKEQGSRVEDIIKNWSELPIDASKRGAIYVNSSDYASIPSGRISLFLDDFRGYLIDFKSR